MKQISLLSDGNSDQQVLWKFIQSLTDAEDLSLAGIFLYPEFGNDATEKISVKTAKHIHPYFSAQFKKQVIAFENFCKAHQFEYLIHIWLWNADELIKETRFSDLLLVSGNVFSRMEQGPAAKLLKDLLYLSECPVLIIPDDAAEIKRVVFAYDGTRESMIAIKTFCNTLPQLCHLPIEINYWVNKTDDDIPNIEYLQEFASRHFTQLNFREIFFDYSQYLSSWMSERKDAILVCGACHRSGLSTLFNQSFVTDVMKYRSAQLFIAHG